MANKKSIRCHGVTYSTIKELALHYELNPDKLRRFLRSGLVAEDAVEQCLAEKDQFLAYNDTGKKFIIYNKDGYNRYYRTYKELCQDNDIRYESFLRHLKSGMSVDDAVTACKKVNRKQFCRENNIPYQRYLYLIKNGVSHEEAVERLGKEHQGNRKVIYQGEVYASKKELSAQLGISYRKLVANMKKGISLQEAIEKSKVAGVQHSLVTRSIPIRVNGISYPSYRAYCRKNGISLSQFQSALKSGKIQLDDI